MKNWLSSNEGAPNRASQVLLVFLEARNKNKEKMKNMSEKIQKSKGKNAIYICKDVDEDKLNLIRKFLMENQIRIIYARCAPSDVFLKVTEEHI